MTSHTPYHNRPTGSQASEPPKRQHAPWLAWLLPLVGPVVVCVAMLVLWNSPPPPAASAQADEPAAESTDDLDLSPEEQRVFDLFERLTDASDLDPNSEEVRRLEAELDLAIERLNEEFDAEPVAPTGRLPQESRPEPTGRQPQPAQTPAPTLQPPVPPAVQPPAPTSVPAEPAAVAPAAAQPDEIPTAPAPSAPATPGRVVRTAPAPKPEPTARPVEAQPPAEAPKSGSGVEEPPAEPAAPSEPVAEQPTIQHAAPTPSAPIDPDAPVQLKTTDNVLDLPVLVEYIGKQLGLNFLYEDTQAIQGEVLLQTYGSIRQKDLLPLLESVLAFNDYVMVQDGAFTRIRKRDPALLKKAQPQIVVGKETPVLAATDTVVVQIIPAEHVKAAELTGLLRLFVSDASAIQPIPNTNYLIVTEYAHRIGRILEMARLVDQPGPPRRLEPVEVQYITASAAQSHLNALLRSLAEQGATMQTPEEAAPARPVRPVRPPRPPEPGQPEEAPEPEPAAPGEALTSIDKGPALYVDERTNRLLIIGTDGQIQQVKDLLAILDVEQPGPEIILEPLTVTHINASDASTRIEALLNSLREQGQVNQGSVTRPGIPERPTERPSSRRPTPIPLPTPSSRGTPVSRVTEKPPVLHVDERTNRLLVVGTAEQIDDIRDLLELIDVVAGPEIRLTVLDLEYVEADEVATQLDGLLQALSDQGATPTAIPAAQTPSMIPEPPQAPDQQRERPTRPEPRTLQARDEESRKPSGPAIFTDVRRGRLLVVGSDAQIAQIQDLLKVLDVPEGPEITLEPIRVEYVLASDVAGQISDLLQALNEQGADLTPVGQPVGRQQQPAARPQPADRQPEPPSSRMQPGQIQSPSEAGAALFVDDRTNRLLVVGSRDQIDQVKKLLALLDVREGPEIKLAALSITHVIATDIADQLSQLLGALTEQGGEIQPGQGRQQSTARPTVSAPAPAQGQAPRDQGPSPEGRRRETSDSAGPFLLVDERTNRLLIVGSDKQIQQLSELLTVLDVPPSEYDKQYLRVYQPQYVEAAELQSILDALGITETAAAESPRDQARSQRQFGGEMSRDQAPPMTESPSATAAAGYRAGQLLPGQEEPEIRIALQETTNKLFILATEYQHAEIQQILEQVDVEIPETAGAIRIYPLENRDPEVVATMLQDLLETEKQAQEEAGGVERIVTIPGKEGAPIVVPLTEIYAVAVRASQKQHEEIAAIIETLDKRLPSVLLEAILVQVTTDDVLNLGVSLQNVWAAHSPDGRNVSGVSPFGFNISRTGSLVAGQGGTVAFFDDDLIYATLEALQTQGNTRVSSMPRVLVNDNVQGTITNRRQEPTTRTTIPAGSDTPIIEFKDYVDAGTTLAITPHISEGEFLQLEIQLDVDSFDGKGSGNIPPPKSVNNVTTTVTVPNGKYIVLGGLTSRTESTTVNKVPLLGDIPLLGAAFRNVARSESDAFLYIFVKADIVRDEAFMDLDALSEKYRARLRESDERYDEQASEVIPGIKLKNPRPRRPLLED